MYDLTKDPLEQHNLLFDKDGANQADVAGLFTQLNAEIARLQKQYKDDGQYADPATWPKGSVDGNFGARKPLGEMSVSEAIAASVDAGSFSSG